MATADRKGYKRYGIRLYSKVLKVRKKKAWN